MKKVIVFGECMIDRYYQSCVSRISPEAPIPVHFIEKIQDDLGGAGNLAHQLNQILPRNKLMFVSVLGNDNETSHFIDLFEKNEIQTNIFYEHQWKNIIKNRIYVNHVMTTRFDIEQPRDIENETQNEIYQFFHTKITRREIECIILSDYQKGVCTRYLCTQLISLCNQYSIPIFVDPKMNDSDKYRNAFLIKPNLYEAKMISNQTNMNSILPTLYTYFNCIHLIVTASENGCYYYHNNHEIYFPHENPENIVVRDVSGAGDIFFAVLIQQYLSHKNIEKSIQVSNYIAGLSVQKVGMYQCNLEDITNYLQRNVEIYRYPSKIVKYSETNIVCKNVIQQVKRHYQNIVFTNGCFDILHIGHLQLLEYAKSLGDFLIVGMNSDSSVKRLKGNSRPIFPQSYRSSMLYHLSYVDLIIIFDEDTPYSLLQKIRPKTLVKGSDYQMENIIGADLVENVEIFEFKENISTSRIISNIKQLS